MQELERASKLLKFDGVHCVNHSMLTDGRRRHWSHESIKRVLTRYLLGMKIRGVVFRSILTFDEDGASSHPNHCETANAVR